MPLIQFNSCFLSTIVLMYFDLRGLIFVTGVMSLADRRIGPHDEYLGPRPSKKFFFPWTVAFHHVTSSSRELIGTGSIMTGKYVLASMDCFIRKARSGLPYYRHVNEIHVITGDLHANHKWDQELPSWVELRGVASIRMFSTPKKRRRRLLFFTSSTTPEQLDTLETSPFGFSMSIALVQLQSLTGATNDGVPYSKIILPIPLHFGNGWSNEVEDSLSKEIALLEDEPFGVLCYVGGWRVGSWRLLQYEVVYVPFEQCEAIYCSYDDRACNAWPVRGVHVCFKSLTFTDLCWRDQGSALYCEQFSESVIAILTSAPTCGTGGLPGVYTLIHYGLALLERFPARDETYKTISKTDLLTKYAPPKYMIPTRDY